MNQSYGDDDFNFDSFEEEQGGAYTQNPKQRNSAQEMSYAPQDNQQYAYSDSEENFGQEELSSDYSQNTTASQTAYSNSSQVSVDKKIVNLSSDIPIQLLAVLGKKSMNVKDLLSLRMGEVLELGRLPHEAIDLVVSGKVIAKAELVEIDGRLGVRILKIF